MIDKILIANRGEIACRVARSAKHMGVATVAVYSDVDRDALHVKQCDQSVALNGVTARQTYLDGDKILAAAKQCDAQAIHPGYGFLSENAEFAERCGQAGIIFIGPTPDSIRIMGSKSAARKSIAFAGIPLLPGYDEDDQDLDILQRHADKIGYPLLIKAVAGGGGKGMRVVENHEDFQPSLEAVKRESSSAFGDDRVMLEKFLPVARHIEVQVFADQNGNAVHLFERDCSMQRRQQKVIEESPAVGMADSLRENITETAVQCARAINYVGAGTIEFLLAPNNEYFFMEMNTRLQVEHPVTEMVTGQDLVEWQIRVASGENLPSTQAELSQTGHAIEARIYAENPDQQFLPSTGKIHYIQQPGNQQGVRVDTGIESGNIISTQYDPMISKLIVWAKTRPEALRKMDHALRECKILGVHNNISFLITLNNHPVFQQGQSHTRFIDSNYDELIEHGSVDLDQLLALACCYELALEDTNPVQNLPSDRWSPWNAVDGWQNNLTRTTSLEFEYDDTIIGVEVTYNPESLVLSLPSGSCSVTSEMPGNNQIQLIMNGQSIGAVVAKSGNQLMIHYQGSNHSLKSIDRRFQLTSSVQHAGTLNAPMPGLVIAVEVAEGDRVTIGTPLLIVEAMKMEHLIKSPKEGVVTEINYGIGDQVQDGDALLVID